MVSPVKDKQLVAQLLERYKPLVLFSGGRDSLVALHLVKSVSDEVGKEVTAIHVDTTVSTPGNLEYVERICRNLEVKLVVLRPIKDFFCLAERWGFPTATRRWCCYHLKIEPIKRYLKEYGTPETEIIFDGIRASESSKRKSYPILGYHRHFKRLCCHPIFHWSSQDVKEYIKEHCLEENPLYQIFPRASECWCTAFKTVEQFRMLKKHFPELFSKFVEAESKLKTGGSALFRGGRRIYLRDL